MGVYCVSRMFVKKSTFKITTFYSPISDSPISKWFFLMVVKSKKLSATTFIWGWQCCIKGEVNCKLMMRGSHESNPSPTDKPRLLFKLRQYFIKITSMPIICDDRHSWQSYSGSQKCVRFSLAPFSNIYTLITLAFLILISLIPSGIVYLMMLQQCSRHDWIEICPRRCHKK